MFSNLSIRRSERIAALSGHIPERLRSSISRVVFLSGLGGPAISLSVGKPKLRRR